MRISVKHNYALDNWCQIILQIGFTSLIKKTKSTIKHKDITLACALLPTFRLSMELIMKKVLAVAFLALMSFNSTAAMIINYYENGTDLVFDYSGSFTFNIVGSISGSSDRQILGAQSLGLNPIFYNYQSSLRSVTFYDEIVSSGTFWGDYTSAPSQSVLSGSGDTFLLRYNGGSSITVWLDASGYTAGDIISGQIVASNSSIASSTIQDWTATFNNGEDSISFVSGRPSSGVVPEPATIGLFGLALFAMRRFRSC